MTQLKSSSKEQKKLRTLPMMLSGSMAGVCAVIVSNIPETVKTRMQLDGEVQRNGQASVKQYASMRHVYVNIVKNEGFRALQAGLGSAICFQIVMNGLRLGLFEPIELTFTKSLHSEPNNFIVKVLAAASAGALGGAFASPFYLAKTRLQSQSPYFHAIEEHHYKNTFHCIKSILHREGIKGLYRGVSAGVVRLVVASATQLSIYDTIKMTAIEKLHFYDGIPAHFIASLIASIVTVTIMNPFDVVATRLFQSAGNRTVYSGMFDCFQKTIRGEGWMALQKGWTPLYMRLDMNVVSSRSCSKGIELAQRILNVWFSNGRYENMRVPSKYDEADPDDMQRWFNSTPEFDERIRCQFQEDIENVAQGQYHHLQADTYLRAYPHHTFSCLLCLDQFPRHIYRHSCQAFAYDEKAKLLSHLMISKKVDKQLPYVERAFIHIPFEHSESLRDQEFSVKYCQNLVNEVNADPNATENLRSFLNLFLIYAILHYDIIAEFGRFPHRNGALQRQSTDREERFLNNGGDRFGQ